jgi:TetR/AcrR family transcriptional regulator, transcriptional repressor for nem operon
MAGTSDQIMDIAQEFIQLRGFNAFSYADIAREIGIKTASIHYHFPSKSDLGRALVERYAGQFDQMLTKIDAEVNAASDKLKAFTNLYFEILQDNRICLCGMLATETESLSEEMREAIRDFFVQNESWLARVFREGRNEGSFKTGGNVESRAKMFHGTVQGALITAKAMGSEERFVIIVQELMNLIV